MPDWIAPVEAAYDLAPSLEGWFGRVIETTQPLLGEMPGLGGYVCSGPAWAPRIEAVAQRGVPAAVMPRYERLIRTGAEEALRLALGAGKPLICSLSERIFTRFPGTDQLFSDTSGVADCLYFVAPSGAGSFLVLGTALAARRPTTPAERRNWTRVAAHIGAGLRLRGALAGSPEPEAVLDPGAKLLDASAPAASSRAREVLREAVRRREHARTQQERTEPERALALWEGLVAGRWSLLDRFESDGKRFVVAHANDPDVGDPRGLSRRERQVAEYAGMGRSQKEIAYVLGISPSAVNNAVRRASEKLGLSGIADLASFFGPEGVRARLSELELGGERLAVTSAPLLDEAALAHLSSAEREVALELVRGATIASIAERRGSSPRTVESQAKAVYAKLGVRSRVELATRLGRS